MSNDIETFLAGKNLEGKAAARSQLTPYTDEILELKKRGYTEKIILQFLQEKKGVVVTQSTLNWFINSRRKKTEQAAVSDAPKTIIKQTVEPKAVKPRPQAPASDLNVESVDIEQDDPWQAEYPADGQYTYPLPPPFDRGAAAVAVDQHGNRYQWGRRLQSWADPSEVDPLGAA